MTDYLIPGGGFFSADTDDEYLVPGSGVVSVEAASVEETPVVDNTPPPSGRGVMHLDRRVFREPGLGEPGRKPVGNVVIDTTNSFGKRMLLGVLLRPSDYDHELTGRFRMEVQNKIPDIDGNDLIFTDTGGNGGNSALKTNTVMPYSLNRSFTFQCICNAPRSDPGQTFYQLLYVQSGLRLDILFRDDTSPKTLRILIRDQVGYSRSISNIEWDWGQEFLIVGSHVIQSGANDLRAVINGVIHTSSGNNDYSNPDDYAAGPFYVSANYNGSLPTYYGLNAKIEMFSLYDGSSDDSALFYLYKDPYQFLTSP